MVSTTRAISKVGAIRVRANPTQKGSLGSENRCLANCPATATATPSVKTEAVTTIPDLGVAPLGRQVILLGMVRMAAAVLLFPLVLAAQRLEPCKPDTPTLRMAEPLQATGLQIGGVQEFPAGIYKPIGTSEDGTFYLYEKPLVAKLFADTVQVPGGLLLPKDPDDDVRGWYTMPDGAKNPVIAPEQGVDSAWEGDPTLPASDPYKAANFSKIRKKVGLSDKPKITPVPPANP